MPKDERFLRSLHGLTDRSPIAARAFLFFAIALSAWRFYRIRNYLEFPDESVEMTTGWLVSEGETLYSSVFSHHMPLVTLACQLVSVVSPSAHPAHFRAAPWAAYVLLTLAIAFGPTGRRSNLGGPLAAGIFLVVVSAVAPLIWGHMVLNDVFWGISFATFFVLFPMALLFGDDPSPRDVALAGAAAALALVGSPLAIFPLLFSLALAVLTTPPARGLSELAAFLAGMGSVAACMAGWLLRFGSLTGFVEEVFRFNTRIYARFVAAESGSTSLVLESLRSWMLYLVHAVPDAIHSETGPRTWPSWIRISTPIASTSLDAQLLAPTIIVTVIVIILVFRRAHLARDLARAAALSSLIVLTVLSLRMRGAGFRAIPLHLTIAAVGVLLPVAPRLRSTRLIAVVLALAFAPAFVKVSHHNSLRFHDDDRTAAEGAWTNVARYIARHTSPDERIAAFPMGAIVYIEARRRPATDALFFLPWQAAWENENPTRPNTCTQLYSRSPRFVALQEMAIWNAYPWKEYAGCIDRFLKANYERVDEPDLKGLLLRRRTP